MIKVRQSVFETNSSSSHSLVVCSKEIWSDFIAGKLFYNVLHESNDLPVFCTLKDIKLYIKRIYSDLESVKFGDFPTDKAALKELRYRISDLLWFEETFYSIDELEGYEYNAEKQEADLNYYFG